jgi:hypothetical protein
MSHKTWKTKVNNISLMSIFARRCWKCVILLEVCYLFSFITIVKTKATTWPELSWKVQNRSPCVQCPEGTWFWTRYVQNFPKSQLKQLNIMKVYFAKNVLFLNAWNLKFRKHYKNLVHSWSFENRYLMPSFAVSILNRY